jgi:type IV pilus assembly protein PilM
MAKKLTSVLGVDLGSQYIKIAEIRMQGRQPAITALGMAQTPPGSVDHIGVHDPASISAVLKQLCAASGVSVGDAVISVAGQGSVLVRTLEVPVMNDSELKQHMEWEITRNIPFAESTVSSDFKPFPPDAAGDQNMDVVMAIAPQSAVDGIIDLVKKAGKKPAALDVEPLGIARSLATSYQGDYAGKTICVVEVGHRTTSINIYRDGKLLMPRQVPIGGEMFTRAIADGLGISFEEAEQMKHSRARIPTGAGAAPAYAAPTFGETQSFASYNPFAEANEAVPAYNPFADDAGAATEPTGSMEPVAEPATDAPAMEAEAPVEAAPITPAAPMTPAPSAAMSDEDLRIYNAMAGVLDEFIAEIRRSIDYYRSKGGDVEQILVCGGASKLKGLTEFIASMIGIPAVMMDPTRNITIQAKKLDPSMLDENRPDFAVAIGNGLHIFF